MPKQKHIKTPMLYPRSNVVGLQKVSAGLWQVDVDYTTEVSEIAPDVYGIHLQESQERPNLLEDRQGKLLYPTVF